MKPIAPFGFPISLSALFWIIIGLARFIQERLTLPSKPPPPSSNRIKPSQVAAVVAAHNEELDIRPCLQSLKHFLKPDQIYVCSDGSTDKTYRRARQEGVHVSFRNPGHGKSQAINYLLHRYQLLDRYRLIFIVDADNRINPDFLRYALPRFNRRQTVAFFGRSRIIWPRHALPRLAYYFVAYRDRLNFLLAYIYMYGQTSTIVNASYVIPGSCALYRSRILKQLNLGTPGIINEDFHLAFQIFKNKLGHVASDYRAYGLEHAPHSLRDYWRQVRRWNIGFHQAIRLNGIWPSFFWLSLAVFTLEVVTQSLFISLLPFIFLLSLLQHYSPLATSTLPLPVLPHPEFIFHLVIILFTVDYLHTVAIALIKHRPLWLFYGVFFYFLHYATSLILFTAIIPGFFRRSDGRWQSPTRHTSTP